MSPENIQLIRTTVQQKASSLDLKPTSQHPVRNPNAHVWSILRSILGKKYDSCDDSEVSYILEIINLIE